MSPTSLRLLGVNFFTEPTSIREALALSSDSVAELLAGFKRMFPESGFLVLSTCARLELYIDADQMHAEKVHDVFDALSGDDSCPALKAASYELESNGTASHLFRVAAGLESPILGDIQILAQLRAAEALARAAGTLTPLLSELLRRALVLGKGVRRETSIAAGGADVGSAVFHTMEDRLDDWSTSNVLIVGAGAASERVVEVISAHGEPRVTVANRSLDKAQRLVSQIGGEAVSLDQVADVAKRAQVIVLATAPDHVVLDDEAIGAVLTENPSLLFIDLVPGGIISTSSGAALVGLDDLADWSDPRRLAALDEVEARCNANLAGWQIWQKSRPVETAISGLYSGLGVVTQRLSDLVGSDSTQGSGREAEIRTILKNWLHPHAAQLRSISSGEVASLTEAMRHPMTDRPRVKAAAGEART